MCGICGVVALDRPAEVDVVRSMLAELRHRGPDGEGLFEAPGVALGHTRLAIIDLSDGGRQPFASDDGALQLLHNGEVFNYVELRARLEGLGHSFRTATDTEVVLRAYEEWGPRCVEQFNGMWALALWDARERRLFCSRDRFGIKPFVFTFDGRRLAFASEPRALRSDPSFVARPNLRAVRDFLAQGHTDHLDETFFAGMRQLPPAHSLAARRERAPPRALLAARARRSARGRGRRDARALPRLASGCGCGATCRSAPPSRAGSTPRRSPSRSTTCFAPRPRTHAPSATASARSRSSSTTAASTSARSRRPSSNGSWPSRAGSRSGRRSSWTSCRGSWPIRASRSARRASSRSGS